VYWSINNIPHDHAYSGGFFMQAVFASPSEKQRLLASP